MKMMAFFYCNRSTVFVCAGMRLALSRLCSFLLRRSFTTSWARYQFV